MSKARPFDKSYLALTGLGVGVRLLFLLLAGGLEPYADESGYIYLALGWNHFGFFSDGGNYLWPPGYPFFLATMFDWFGVNGVYAAKLVQVLASSVIGYSLMLIARRVLDHRAAIVAGLIWCFYLPLIGFTHYLWPETLFLTFFVPVLYLLVSASPKADGRPVDARRFLAAGLLMGVSLLIKESMLYLSVILTALIVWRFRRNALMEGVRHAALFAMALAVVVLPWMLRNYEVYGRYVPVAASLGENCYQGIFRRYQNFDYPPPLVGKDEVGRVRASPQRRGAVRDAPLADLDGETFYPRIYGRGHWMFRWFIQRPREAEWDRALAGSNAENRARPGGRQIPNTVDQSKANVAKAIAFIKEYPQYFALARVKRLSNWASPTSFFVRHNALGRYDGLPARTAFRRLLLVAALALPMLVLIGAIPGLLWTMRGSADGAVLRWTVLYAFIPAMLVGMSRHRIAIEPVLIVAAAGFFSRLGRPRNLKLLPGALVVLGWGLLAFLWLLAAREVTAVAALVWRG